MFDPILIRSLGLFLPLIAAWLLWMWREPDRRQGATALLASLWNVPTLLLLHLLALRFGWWQFNAEGGLFLGIPIDLLLGWILLWGVVPALAFRRFPPLLVLWLMFGLDLLVMPLTEPVIQLGSNWLIGEVVGLVFCLLPAFLLARWTAEERHLIGRACLQFVIFSALTFWTLPTIILTLTGGSWAPFLSRATWINSLGLQLLVIPAVLGISALQEFVRRGNGTPLPYDPPQRLVRSGVYAYIANPMQFSMVLLLIGWGLMLESLWVSGAGLMALIYSAGLAAWDEGGDLAQRFGTDWSAYRRAVGPWWFRWQPASAEIPGQTRAKLYVASECGPCSELGGWFLTHQPVGLDILAAEDHPRHDLTRLTYDPCDGCPEEVGVAALARALEHLHLGWALIGWVIRLPVIIQFIQLIVDAVGGEPRLIRRRSEQINP